MTMENFPGNSKNPVGKERPTVEKVVTTEVVVRKKPLSKKFKDVFFGGDFKNALRYVAADVLLPALRNMIADAGTEGIRRIVFPESQNRPVRRDYRNSYSPRTTYNQNPLIRPGRDPRDRPAYLPDQPPHVSRQGVPDVNDFIIHSREEAEIVLGQMMDILEKYESVSVADFYSLLGVTSPYTYNDWGWTNFNHAIPILQIREGFVIDLPAPLPFR